MTLLITLAIIYGVGFVLTALIAGIAYGINRDTGWDDEERTAARWLIGSPVWPVLVFRALIHLLAAAKATLKEDDQ